MAEKRYSLDFEKYLLRFKTPAGTSRGILLEKPSYFLYLKDQEKGITGTAECSLIPGLSPDDLNSLEDKIQELCRELYVSQNIRLEPKLSLYPALRFAWETALLDLKNGGRQIIFDNSFSRGESGIVINGLIWMNEPEDMWKQIQQKVSAGFHCIKMKIGALDYKRELELLERFRLEYGNDLTIRVDANGAFPLNEAFRKLERLAKYNIHSIEQPIKAGQWEAMSELCAYTPVPIALDEELIGIHNADAKIELLDVIRPQYIILKPSLLGGLAASDEWIKLAVERTIGWWATSALESNIGLNAIAQWTADKQPVMPQGLGTGGLFVNNIEVPLKVQGEELWRIAEKFQY